MSREAGMPYEWGKAVSIRPSTSLEDLLADLERFCEENGIEPEPYPGTEEVLRQMDL